MKKISYLLVVLFALFAFTACEEDENVTPEPEAKITTEDLVGNWDFVSLEFEGETYTSCDPDLNSDYYYTTLNFYDMTESEVMLYTECVDIGDEIDDRVYPYTLDGDIIDCYNGARVFKIMNYESFDGSTLIIKLLEPSDHTKLPIGGVYTLKR